MCPLHTTLMHACCDLSGFGQTTRAARCVAITLHMGVCHLHAHAGDTPRQLSMACSHKPDVCGVPMQVMAYDGRAALPWALRLGDRFQKVQTAMSDGSFKCWAHHTHLCGQASPWSAEASLTSKLGSLVMSPVVPGSLARADSSRQKFCVAGFLQKQQSFLHQAHAPRRLGSS